MTFPPEQFATDLLHLYGVANRKRLIAAYLQQLLATFTEIYLTQFTPGDQPNSAYKAYLETCLDALTAVTNAVPAAYLESNAPPPLFTLPQHSGPEFTPALQALAIAFNNKADELAKFGVLTRVDRGTWTKRAPNPDAYEYRSDYNRARKEHEGARQAYFNAFEPWRWPFANSPLFSYAPKFLPPTIQVPFDIEERLWFEGTWIVGATGRGKTNLLRHLVLHHQQNGAVIILDPKGDLRKSFERYAPLRERLVLIEPDLEHPPAINPLDMGSNNVDFLSYLFELLDTRMTQHQMALFRAVLTLCEKIPNATIATFRDILQGGWRNYAEYVQQLDPEDRHFFEKEFTDRVYVERKPEISLRLRLLMSNSYLRAMFRSTETKLNMGELMDAGKIILINNSYDPDKLGEEGAEFFGRMIIAMVWAAARRRASLPDDQKVPVYFFIDEAHTVIARDKTIKKILNQCRSQKIAMIFAHQDLKDIEDPTVQSALSDRAILFANARSQSKQLAEYLHAPSPEFVSEQPRGSFACYVVEKTKEAVHVQVPHVKTTPDQRLADYPILDDSQYAALKREMRARFGTKAEEPVPTTARALKAPLIIEHDDESTGPVKY